VGTSRRAIEKGDEQINDEVVGIVLRQKNKALGPQSTYGHAIGMMESTVQENLWVKLSW